MKCWCLTSKGLVSLQKLRSMTSLALPLHTKMTKSQSSRSQKKNENFLKSWTENLIIWQECWKTDWGPGQMVSQFKYLRYDSFSDLSRMVEKSSKGNEAVIIVEIFHWQDWKSFFADEFSLIKSIRNYHYFRFSAIYIYQSRILWGDFCRWWKDTHIMLQTPALIFQQYTSTCSITRFEIVSFCL